MIISKIKSFLKEQKLDFFLQKNCDEFFSEYLRPQDKLIEAATNFSGSNAAVIFGQNKSYFFTDGRYILQAKQQLNLDEFELIDLGETSLISWIKSNINDEKILAFDPKNLAIDFVNLLKCNKIALAENPLRNFVECAQAKQIKAFELSEKITGQDSLSKRKLIAQNLQEGEALFITRADEVCWLLNIRGCDIEFNPFCLAYAVLYSDASLDLIGDNEGFAEINFSKVRIIKPTNFANYFVDLRKKINKVLCDFSSTNYWVYQHFLQNDFAVFNSKNFIEIAKAQKNPIEILGMKKGHEIDGIAVTKFLFWLEKSMAQGVVLNEIMVAEKLLELRQKNKNFLYPSFATIAGFASNGAIIHYHASAKTNKSFSKKSPPSLLLVDSGGQYCGADFCATTDITRSIAIGEPSAQMIGDFTRVLKGHLALARAKFVRGTTGAQLDVLARNFLWLDCKDYAHGTGHGVGAFLGVHEGPCAISKRAHAPLQENMILSNEPGFYQESEYGIRIENLMLIEKIDDNFLGFKTLTLAPLDYRLIDFKMLTYPEKKWLRNYHQEIFDKISPSLENDEKAWLSTICEVFNNLVS